MKTGSAPNLSITLVTRDSDYLAPLACGDVVVDGVDLHLDRATSIFRVPLDPSIDGGELSFSAHMIRLAHGDRSFVGIPFFAYKAFRHRCFFVRRDSGLRSFRELEGKRVGTNGWADTGNTWGRALLREQGVEIDSVCWWVGSVDDPAYDPWHGAEARDLPAYVHTVEAGCLLRDMLLDGRVDALMCPPPVGFYEPGSPIVRLLPDYRSAEQDYYRRTGIYPTQHIFGLRRELFERHPWLVGSLYNALEQSMARWLRNRRRMAETTPWLLSEIEETVALMGEDWHTHGVEPNRVAIQALCDEEYAQGLIPEPLEVARVFAEFQEVVGH